MRCFVARNARQYTVRFLLLAAAITTLFVPRAAFAQSSSVYATLCGATSQIAIAQPVSDSTVTSPEVVVGGTVSQANQIEVYINDEFDSTIPLVIGQSTYSSTIQLPSGTHTIKVEAINSCGGQNGEATSVITYTPPPAQASSGEGANTQVASSQGSGIRVGTPPTVTSGDGAPMTQESTPLGLPPAIGRPLEQLLDWLNISHQDNTDGPSSLSIGRAVFVVGGMYFLVLGIAPAAARVLASSTAFVALTPHADMLRRRQLVRWGVRGVGLLILLLALFL